MPVTQITLLPGYASEVCEPWTAFAADEAGVYAT